MDDFVGFLIGYLAFLLVIFVITAIGKWKVFEKAGQPGWGAIVPIYEFYISSNEIAKKETLWFVLFVVGLFVCGPLALVALFVVNVEVANKFGKGAGYGIGLTLLPFIFYPLLGFSDARYRPGRGNAVREFEDDDYGDDEDRPRKKNRDDNW